jgi:hypothetical protein
MLFPAKRWLGATGSAGAPASASALTVRAAAWVAVVPLLLLHVLARDEGFDPEAGLLGGLLASLALLSVVYARPGTLPALAGVLLKLYIGAGTVVFQHIKLEGIRGRIRLSRESLTLALFAIVILALLCILAQPVGARLGRWAAPKVQRLTVPARGHTSTDSVVVRTVSLLCALLYAVVTTYSRGTSTFGGLEHAVTLICSAPLPLTLLFLDMQRSPSPWARATFAGVLGLYVVVGLGIGMLGAAAEPVVAAAVLQWAVVGRIPWRGLLPFLTVLVLLNTAKHEYRALTWNRDHQLGVADRVSNWIDAIGRTYSGNAADEAQRSATAAATRIQIVAQVAQVIEWVPHVVPYAGPDVWLDLPLEFIPRFLWPDKPVHNVMYNSRYTLTFRLQHERTMGNTSLALPPVADGYWRLGWLGVVVEGLLLGLVCGFYSGIFRADARANAALGVMFAATMSAEMHVMGLVAGQPQQLIAVVGMVVAVQQLTRLFEGNREAALPTASPRGRA